MSEDRRGEYEKEYAGGEESVVVENLGMMKFIEELRVPRFKQEYPPITYCQVEFELALFLVHSPPFTVRVESSLEIVQFEHGQCFTIKCQRHETIKLLIIWQSVRQCP